MTLRMRGVPVATCSVLLLHGIIAFES